MIQTALFDLDDTLLANDMNQFLPAYLSLLSDHMKSITNPDQMLKELLQGTQDMLSNLDPMQTLEEVFAAHFYPALQLEEAKVRERIDQFYESVFPQLRDLTRSKPEAVALIKRTQQLGLDLVIATNPLFPSRAIHHRLSWAGLHPREVDFNLITSYEHMHFAKPHLAYYAEILARLGCAPHEALMVGNDLEEDVQPAKAMGMAVFHIGETEDPDIPSGSLEDSIAWLERAEGEVDREAVNRPEVVLARLRGNLGGTLTKTEAIPPDCWDRRPTAEEWAPVEILYHLWDVEREVNLPRVKRILQSEDPFIPGQETDHWAEERQYLQRPAEEALKGFRDCRMEVISLLEPLSDRDWERPAQHALLGPSNLSEIASISTQHDVIHLRQLRSTLAQLAYEPLV